MSALVDTITKLLAKAEATEFEAEAEALVAKAQELATAHSIDLATARARQAARGARVSPAQRTVVTGERGRQGLRHLVQLMAVVAAANDVRVDVAHGSASVVLYGFPDDLDVTERLWSSLAVQLAASGQRRLAGGEHRVEGVHARTFRTSHATAFVQAVGGRLRSARSAAVAAAPAGAGGAELVLRDKGREVGDFHAGSSSARGSWRGWGGPVGSVAGWQAGSVDGSRARLGTEPALPGAAGRLTG